MECLPLNEPFSVLHVSNAGMIQKEMTVHIFQEEQNAFSRFICPQGQKFSVFR